VYQTWEFKLDTHLSPRCTFTGFTGGKSANEPARASLCNWRRADHNQIPHTMDIDAHPQTTVPTTRKRRWPFGDGAGYSECGDECSGTLTFGLLAIGEFVSLSGGFSSLPPHGFQLQATEGFGVTKIGNVLLLHWLWASSMKLQSQLGRDSPCGDSIEELVEG